MTTAQTSVRSDGCSASSDSKTGHQVALCVGENRKEGILSLYQTDSFCLSAAFDHTSVYLIISLLLSVVSNMIDSLAPPPQLSCTAGDHQLTVSSPTQLNSGPGDCLQRAE